MLTNGRCIGRGITWQVYQSYEVTLHSKIKNFRSVIVPSKIINLEPSDRVL
jgi:hypothetical protein